MIKIEHIETFGWEAAIRGMRNPMNSWDKSDSKFSCSNAVSDGVHFPQCVLPLTGDYNIINDIGPNDLRLMEKLVNAGTDHRKFMRMITVYLDITAPLYWWKEFDTYKVGTVANSCSTMHKIADKEFMLEDFSRDYLYAEDDVAGMYYSTTAEEEFTSTDVLKVIIEALNNYRKMYLAAKDKKDWWQMIQLLPSSYNQRRTVMLNYEVLANIYKSRRNHKLYEWVDFCAEIERLPYSELITKKEDDQK